MLHWKHHPLLSSVGSRVVVGSLEPRLDRLAQLVATVAGTLRVKGQFVAIVSKVATIWALLLHLPSRCLGYQVAANGLLRPERGVALAEQFLGVGVRER